MRKGIFKDVDGVRTFDLQKIIDKGFGNGWYTNFKGRYRIFEGARNTGKSKRMIGYESLCKIMSDPRRNVLITRKNDSDNRQSTFANITRCISDLGLERFFKATTQVLEITYLPTGQKIIFRGLNNPTSLTSLEFSTGYLTDVYIEEAYEINSFDDFEMIDGSLRAGNDFDENGNLVENDIPLQITMCLNPWTENWIYETFFKGRLEPDYTYLETHKYADYRDDNYIGKHGTGLYLHVSTFRVNRFRNVKDVDIPAAEMKKTNNDLYRTVYLGMWGATGGLTYPEFGEHCLATTEEILRIPVLDWALGIDAGFSNGEGKKRLVRKGEDVDQRVRSATTMTLVGVTPGYKQILVIDEYYHTNIGTRFDYNTDEKRELTMPEIAANIIKTIIEWRTKYNPGRLSPSMLMKGHIKVYYDSADIGFGQVLQLKSREMGLYDVTFSPSTKTPINGRVLFEKYLMSRGDFIVNKDKCKNAIREIKLSRGGEKGEIRTDENDHVITSYEYSMAPFRTSFVHWKTFNKDV